MTLLLAVALVVPMVVAVAMVVTSSVASRRSRPTPSWTSRAVPAVAALVGLAWVVVAAVGEPPTWGSFVATPSVAVALAGIAALVTAVPAERAAGRATSLTALTVFGVGACADGVVFPDRALAGGIVALALLAAVGAIAEGAGRWTTAIATVGAVVAAVGVALDDADQGALLAVAGTAVVLVVAVLGSRDRVPSGVLVLPALALAVSESVAVVGRADDVDRIGIAGAVLGAAVAVAALLGRSTADPVSGAVRDPLALAVVGAGIVVLTQDLAEARGAGLLLVAGGVLALAARHPVGLAAAVPGVTATLVAFGAAGEPVHAAAGAAAILLVLAGSAAAPTATTVPRAAIPRTMILAAVAFGVLPAWGWAGVALPDHAVGLATAAALALPVVVLAASPLPRGSWQATGRIPRRRETAANPTHGSTIQEADRQVAPEEEVDRPQDHRLEEEDPDEAGPEEASRGQEEAGEQEDGTTQRPVAVPPQPVLVRARVRGPSLRGRVRARPGRTP